MQQLNHGLCMLHLQVNELQSKMSRFHGLTAANPERKTIASIVTDGCESLKWQVGDVLRLLSYVVAAGISCSAAQLLQQSSTGPLTC
jgi:hypothetical protein